MEFDNTFEVPLPPAQAWKLLLDIERIAPCMPGAELTEVVSKNIYKGKIGVRLGPVALDLRRRRQVGGYRRFRAYRASGGARHRCERPRRRQCGLRFPSRAGRQRIEGRGAHQSHAVGGGGAIRARRRHHPGNRRAAHESVRQVPGGKARAGPSGCARFRPRCSPRPPSSRRARRPLLRSRHLRHHRELPQHRPGLRRRRSRFQALR